MTRIDFHFNAEDKLGYACRLARKIYRSGTRAMVYSSDAAQLADFDRLLWTFGDVDFIPHVSAGDPLAPETPIVLATQPADAGCHEVLVNIGPETPPMFSRFERLIELVSTDEQDRAAARERWRFYRDHGYPMNRHDVVAR